MKRSTLPGSGRRLATKGVAAALATVTAASVAGMAVSPAQSAIGAECPEAFPVSEIETGDPVDGLTVTQGTTPEPFTGKVLGVLEDGIMPGLDMIMVRLGSADGAGSDPRINDVGIWSGMSGSPVYAEDGRLLGAVAYGLAYGPSTVAGLTPAADMRELFKAGADLQAQPAETVEVPERVEDRVVASGAATRTEVEGGLTELDVMGMSGLGERRFEKVTNRLDLNEIERMMTGGAGADGLDATSIVSGGNLAAAISYGDISYAGVGTATMVCGEEVVGFGHPMMWNGLTELSLHPAHAVYVQEDPAWAGFKVANLGSPVGTIDNDRRAGVAGAFGTIPEATEITSHVTSGTRERTGTSWVNVSEWVPEVGLFHLLSNEDRVFDSIGEGSGTVSYVIQGETADGEPFAVTRSDVYANKRDVTWATAWDLYMTLGRLTNSRAVDLTIESVETDSDLTEEVRMASVKEVSIKQGRKWAPLSQMRRLVLAPGSTVQLKVDLLHSVTGPESVRLELPILKRDAGRRGYLEVVGGNSTSSWWGGRNLPLDKLIDRIEGAPHNDDIVAGVHFWRTRKSERNVHRLDQTSFDVPVSGGEGVRLRILGGDDVIDVKGEPTKG